MASFEFLKTILSTLPEFQEDGHFEKQAFKVRKKIFCTWDLNTGVLVAKLGEIDQSAFCSFDTETVRPVKGGWGKMGWTEVILERIAEETLTDIVRTAYRTVAPAKLGNLVR